MVMNQGKVDEELFQAQAHLYKYVLNYFTSMSLKCAIQLNIPDIIHSHGRPITLPELLSALKIDPAKSTFLYRLMRLLVHSGFFSTTKDDSEEEVGYDLTPSSRLLVKDNIPCLSSFSQFLFNPIIVHSSESLRHWFCSNDPSSFHTAHGMGMWEYISQNQEVNRFFNDSMIGDSSMLNLVMKDCKSVFEGFDTLVDVGGGNGSSVRIIAEAFPNMECIVFDLPHVVEDMQDSGNLKFVGGSMLQYIPPGDSFLFKLVLHCYGDEVCVKVLKMCREAIASKGKEGKVIIIDIVIGEEKDEADMKDAKLLFDAFMLSAVAGKERQEKEWKKLFLEAGFSHYKITPLFGFRSLIEVYP